MKIDIDQLEFIDRGLRDILLWIEDRTGEEQTIINLICENGVYIGADLRCRDIDLGELIEKMVNNRWQYDPTRPNRKCAGLHGEGWDLHLHIKVNPNTRKRVL